MLSLVSQSVKDASVLRRLEFAATYLPHDMPDYADYVIAFALKNNEARNYLTPQQALQFVENIKFADSAALASDVNLVKEIVMMKSLGSDDPLGVILISSISDCRNCGMKLYTRSGRTCKVTIYDDVLGTLPATHYTRYCRKKGCSLQQHYGYYTQGDPSIVRYDEEWYNESYFMSTRETAFSMDMLKRLDHEVLIGQISYKQRAELYNMIHWQTDKKR